MAEQVIKMKIQLRRGTAAEWELSKDVVPAAGEPCFVTDKNILKIGDGETTFEKLEPINGSNFNIAADGKSIVFEDGVVKIAGFDNAKDGAMPRKNAEGGIEWVVPSADTEITTLQDKISVLENDVDFLHGILIPDEEGAETLEDRVFALESDVDKIEGSIQSVVVNEVTAQINEFATKMSDDETVNTFKELVDYVANHGGEIATMASDITLLQSLVGNDPVKDQILAATKDKVDKVDGMGLSSNDFTDSLLSKLEAIEEHAQANTIEKISIGGSVLDIVDKTASIPVAGLDRAGVVKSATGANKVNISRNGEMSVNKVSVHSIFIPIGDELILDGGSSSKNTPVYSTRIGNIGFDSISDAVNCADNGDVVTLQEDVNMGAGDNDHLVVNTENVTIDLGGKALTANGSSGAIKVEGGVTTLDGTGTVNGTLGSDNYSMAVWANNGTVVINDGIYKNETDGSSRGTDLIYASGTGCIEINGGIFEAAKPEWTLNCKDADYKAGTAKIIVKGGSFKGFDPANNSAEGAGTNFVADGYKSVKEGEYYVVKPV